MAILNFDARTVAPATSPVVLPEGWYTAQITSSEMKPTKDGTASYLQLGLTVLDGEHAGCTIIDRLNLCHSNPVVEEIAQRTLSAICHATGVFQITDTALLHGIPLQVRVTVDPPRKVGDKEYAASNNVRGYRYANGSELVASKQGGAPAGAAPASAPVAPPAAPTAPVAAPAAPLRTPPAPPATTAAPVAPVAVAAPVAAPVAPAPVAAPVAPVAETATDAPTPPWAF